MRLDDKTRNIIKTEVASLLGADAVVRLFGSRVDDAQRGGDIDLLVEPRQALASRIQAECRLAARLLIKLGGRLRKMLNLLYLIPFAATTLVIGFFLASFGYMALFARLTQFVWCFQAATMRRTEMPANRAG